MGVGHTGKRITGTTQYTIANRDWRFRTGLASEFLSLSLFLFSNAAT
jgi:hypothetical protein